MLGFDSAGATVNFVPLLTKEPGRDKRYVLRGTFQGSILVFEVKVQ